VPSTSTGDGTTPHEAGRPRALLRAAATIADDPDVLVIGSQSILGSADEDQLPPMATASIEVDLAFFDDPDSRKSDLVDGVIGELSAFHEMYGYYAQGVSVSTARLPRGWRERLVTVETNSTGPGRGHCLDPHDCVLAKLLAGREKDHAFAGALLAAGFVDLATLKARLDLLDDADPVAVDRVRQWLISAGGAGAT
jgi:hypothetical protein